MNNVGNLYVSLPIVIPDSLNLCRASCSTFVVLTFFPQQVQKVMKTMCNGKKRMVHTMQNQQVRNGAENFITSPFMDVELVELC